MALTILNVAYPFAHVGPDAVGGAEQVLSQLDRSLVEHGHRSIVIACAGSRIFGTHRETPWKGGSLDAATQAKLRRDHRRAIESVLSSEPVDVIHFHGLDFAEYLPEADCPTLATLHLPPDWYSPEIFAKTRPRTFLHCVSATQRSRCPSPPHLLPEIPNGVHLPPDKTQIRRRDFAVALGRICPEKGFHLAMDAARIAGMPILLAGKVFPYLEHLRYFDEILRPKLDRRARFLGPAGPRKKRRLLASARCLLIPSLVPETSSLVAMEALACGTPVIAFRAGALTEIVEDGKTGFLVRDEIAMARAIRSIGEIDPRACVAAARERFSLDRMISKYFAYYEKLKTSE